VGSTERNRNEYLHIFIEQLRNKLENGSDKHYIVTEPWIRNRFTPGDLTSPQLTTSKLHFARCYAGYRFRMM
jgi:hypothetical protein